MRSRLTNDGVIVIIMIVMMMIIKIITIIMTTIRVNLSKSNRIINNYTLKSR